MDSKYPIENEYMKCVLQINGLVVHVPGFGPTVGLGGGGGGGGGGGTKQASTTFRLPITSAILMCPIIFR